MSDPAANTAAADRVLNPRNRPASDAELAYAARLLWALDEPDLAARLAAFLGRTDDRARPLAIGDVGQIGDDRLILIAPGRQDVPASLFEISRCVIGLPGERYPASPPYGTGPIVMAIRWPRLRLVEARPRDLLGPGNRRLGALPVVSLVGSRLARLELETPVPTLLECRFGGDRTRGDDLFECHRGPGIEILDTRARRLWEGRDWALVALADTGYREIERGRRAVDLWHEARIRLRERMRCVV